MERALIIGCGYVGSALAARLRGAGIEVSGTSATGGPGLLPLDLTAEDHDLELAAAGAVVYYMVSTLARRYDAADRPHLRPLERCLAALERQPPAGLIYLSSTSVYGDQDGAWIGEQTPTAPQTPWGRMRVELERRVWDFGAALGLPACVVRLPEIYGPDRGPLARLRRGYSLRYPARFTNRIHVDDLAQILEQLGRRLEPELLLAADDEPAPARKVYGHAATLMGLGPVAESTPDPDVDENRLGLMRESKRCRNTRLKAWLEAPLRYPTYREGIAALYAADTAKGT